MKSKHQTCIKLGAIALLILLFFSIEFFVPDFYRTVFMMIQDRNINGIASYIASFGYMAMIMTVLIIVITNMTGLPSIEVLTVSGRIFGLMPGILLCWIGEVIGNIMAFCIIRFFFRNKAHECIEKNKILEKMDSYSNFKEMFIARLIPFSPNVLITTLGALSHLSFRDHTLATIIGKLPSVALEVWLGYGLIQKINGGNAMWMTIICIIVATIAFYVYKHKITI
ncbi:MAG: VTT domain-containing protein [Megasphaera sp.]|jgi:uncharacterized membrane protein YdjX (TVP38/TMEM64 family)|uniref:TVP38/TMEM64 family protein n=1 Tax=Megasphaera sueciensis TaxID=349094 RepID=UPI003CFF4ABD|nr:VTT domain-containing protein [Megasphaera sp.]MCI1823084.1 VTT domain-containing protein [Megasphaera sp.]